MYIPLAMQSTKISFVDSDNFVQIKTYSLCTVNQLVPLAILELSEIYFMYSLLNLYILRLSSSHKIKFPVRSLTLLIDGDEISNFDIDFADGSNDEDFSQTDQVKNDFGGSLHVKRAK
eukprot:m.251663 g.251663  ORF g.251663 m.251663 type:complete len:118 (+) comp40338_c0_seq2:616-969(+)